MGKGFASVLEAFGPFISAIELGIVNLSSKFADIGNSSGLQSFVNYVEQEAPVVGKFFESAAPAVEKLVAALAPLGEAALRQVTPLLTNLGNFAPVIGLAAGAMDTFGRGLQAVLGPAPTLTKWIGQGAAAVGGFLGSVGNFLGITGSASDSTKALSDALQKAGLSANDAQKDIDLYGTTAISKIGAANFAAQQFANQLDLTTDQYKALTASSGESGSKLVSDLAERRQGRRGHGQRSCQHGVRFGRRFKKLAQDIQQAAAATQTSFATAADGVQAFSGQVGVSAGDIATWYDLQTVGAQQFASNLQAAIQAGYNPAIIQQVLEAGPGAGQRLSPGPGERCRHGLRVQINSAATAMSTIGQQAIEESRVVTEAVHKNSADAAADSAAALALDQAKWAVTAGEPVALAIQQLTQQYPNFAQAAAEYGIPIPKAFVDAFSPTVAATSALASQGPAALSARAPEMAACRICWRPICHRRCSVRLAQPRLMPALRGVP